MVRPGLMESRLRARGSQAGSQMRQCVDRVVRLMNGGRWPGARVVAAASLVARDEGSTHAGRGLTRRAAGRCCLCAHRPAPRAGSRTGSWCAWTDGVQPAGTGGRWWGVRTDRWPACWFGCVLVLDARHVDGHDAVAVQVKAGLLEVEAEHRPDADCGMSRRARGGDPEGGGAAAAGRDAAQAGDPSALEVVWTFAMARNESRSGRQKRVQGGRVEAGGEAPGRPCTAPARRREPQHHGVGTDEQAALLRQLGTPCPRQLFGLRTPERSGGDGDPLGST